jgi:flagellar basal-body rod protein FlgB
MAISEFPILSMLRTRMQWHQERQKVLAEKVAKADTPGVPARYLAALQMERLVAPPNAVALARTDPGHLGASSFGGADGFEARRDARYDIRPSGNGVILEDEMLKVAANQMDYQAVTSLYSRSLGLFKTALGKI